MGIRMGNLFRGRAFYAMIMIPVIVIMPMACGGIVEGPFNDTELPTVISTDPVDGAMGFALNDSISVTFSEPMNPISINTSSFLVENRDAVGNPNISGEVSYSEMDMEATFNPDNPLLNDTTTYRVTITTEMTDLAGNPLQVDPPDIEINWDFTTIQ